MDPPEHTRYRRLVSKAFTPRRMKLLEEDIRTLCASLLDDLEGRSSFDYVQDFGARVPAYVIAALLGVPPEDRDTVRGWIDESFHLDPETGMSNDVSTTAMFSFMEYLGATLADRQENPRDDMFTDLVYMEIVEEDGEPRRLTLEQAVNFAALIGSAGTETVARMLGWAALTLDKNPEQRAELAADPGLIPNCVEEILRYEAPSPVQSRWCTADVEVHGGTIPARSKVVMITGSGGTRRSGLSRRRPLRHPSEVRSPFVVRLRHPLLPGCGPGPNGRTDRPRGDVQALPGVVGGHGPCRTSVHEHGPGLLEASDQRLNRDFPPTERPWPSCTLGAHPALVAQRTRASDYGSEGWGFESLRARG